MTIESDTAEAVLLQKVISALRSKGAEVVGAREIEGSVAVEEAPIVPGGDHEGYVIDQLPESKLEWLGQQTWTKHGKWAACGEWLEDHGYT